MDYYVMYKPIHMVTCLNFIYYIVFNWNITDILLSNLKYNNQNLAGGKLQEPSIRIVYNL
jgi:hypothetical protein